MQRKFDHPNILPWYKTYVNKDFKLIVTKYCNEGNLYNAINSQKSFQLDHAINALQQISEAIAVTNIFYSDFTYIKNCSSWFETIKYFYSQWSVYFGWFWTFQGYERVWLVEYCMWDIIYKGTRSYGSKV